MNAPLARCECSHLWGCHDFGKRGGKTVRTACSHGLGPRGEKCPCRLFAAIDEDACAQVTADATILHNQ